MLKKYVQKWVRETSKLIGIYSNFSRMRLKDDHHSSLIFPHVPQSIKNSIKSNFRFWVKTAPKSKGPTATVRFPPKTPYPYFVEMKTGVKRARALFLQVWIFRQDFPVTSENTHKAPHFDGEYG